MLTLLIVGVLILVGVIVVCFAAYKIKAESFEVSTAILKLISFSIKIKSPDRRRRGEGDQADNDPELSLDGSRPIAENVSWHAGEPQDGLPSGHRLIRNFSPCRTCSLERPGPPVLTSGHEAC
ncbi:MAG: hypothetical protein ACRDNF_07120 [Streptosporangiaceae bacterium]